MHAHDRVFATSRRGETLPDHRLHRIRRRVVRALLAAVLLEALWLVTANVALNLSVTQEKLSALRPEKVRLSWKSAWSWYPGRVVVHDAVVSGQTPTLQWQAEADRVAGNVALLSLLRRQVTVRAGRVENGRYRQRPRLVAGRDYKATLPWFPPISGYDVAARGERPVPHRPPWTVTVKNARLSGQHEVWIQRFRGNLSGHARADLEVRSQGGPLRLSANGIAFDIGKAWADEDTGILDGGSLSGSMSLGPYRYRAHRGPASIAFLDLDVDLALESPSLDFVRLFLLKYPSLEVDGTGRASGRLVVHKGHVAPGTDIAVDAHSLVLTNRPFLIEGDGTVTLSGDGTDPLPFSLAFRFGALNVLHHDDRSAFLSGRDLHVELADDGRLFPPGADAEPRFRAEVTIPDAVVEDMTTFNRYLPANSPFAFTGGSAGLEANLELLPDDADGHLTLLGEKLDVRLDDQQLGLDLRVDGVVAGGLPPARRFDLAGTILTLDRARVAGEESRFDENDWSARATLGQADLLLEHPLGLDLSTDLVVSDTRPVAALFRNNGAPDWVARRLTVDDLTGSARLQLQDNRLFVSDAGLGAEELEIGARGEIGAPSSDGVFYLRYKRLDVMLRIEQGERDLVLIRPLEKFEAYQVALPGDE